MFIMHIYITPEAQMQLKRTSAEKHKVLVMVPDYFKLRGYECINAVSHTEVGRQSKSVL